MKISSGGDPAAFAFSLESTERIEVGIDAIVRRTSTISTWAAPDGAENI